MEYCVCGNTRDKFLMLSPLSIMCGKCVDLLCSISDYLQRRCGRCDYLIDLRNKHEYRLIESKPVCRACSEKVSTEIGKLQYPPTEYERCLLKYKEEEEMKNRKCTCGNTRDDMVVSSVIPKLCYDCPDNLNFETLDRLVLCKECRKDTSLKSTKNYRITSKGMVMCHKCFLVSQGEPIVLDCLSKYDVDDILLLLKEGRTRDRILEYYARNGLVVPDITFTVKVTKTTSVSANDKVQANSREAAIEKVKKHIADPHDQYGLLRYGKWDDAHPPKFEYE